MNYIFFLFHSFIFSSLTFHSLALFNGGAKTNFGFVKHIYFCKARLGDFFFL